MTADTAEMVSATSLRNAPLTAFQKHGVMMELTMTKILSLTDMILTAAETLHAKQEKITPLAQLTAANQTEQTTMITYVMLNVTDGTQHS